MECIDWIVLVVNLLVIIGAPILSVIIAQCLQNRSAKRKDKIEIFKTLVSTKAYGWGSNYTAVNVLNSIPVIFADDELIVNSYFKYLDACNIDAKTATESQLQAVEDTAMKLLETMAEELKYKKEWQIFTKSYMPNGVVNDMTRRRQFEDMQLCVGDYMTKIAKNNLNLGKNEVKEKQNG